MSLNRTPLSVVKRWSSTAALPYNSIPGPPGKGWPVIGHMNLFVKQPYGMKKSWHNIKVLRKQHLKESDKLMRLHLPLFNPINGNFVVLLDPTDGDQLQKHEGKYPNR